MGRYPYPADRGGTLISGQDGGVLHPVEMGYPNPRWDPSARWEYSYTGQVPGQDRGLHHPSSGLGGTPISGMGYPHPGQVSD